MSVFTLCKGFSKCRIALCHCEEATAHDLNSELQFLNIFLDAQGSTNVKRTYCTFSACIPSSAKQGGHALARFVLDSSVNGLPAWLR